MSADPTSATATAMPEAAAADLRCIRCNGQQLRWQETAEGGTPAYCCPACGAAFGSALGVPYFGDFESDDILGLIEIAANAVNRGKFGITPETVVRLDALAAAYDRAQSKADFRASCAEAQSSYFLNRYGEWVEITELTRELDLQGKHVLDMGAGLGYDSHRLALRGAAVTALEFSPVLAESGKANFPTVRWIGGFSHFLPFRNGSFDAVFCNAALHHMRDIPAALSEALRVLRPGGVLITTCDSFRPSDSGDGAELDIFDRDPAVLLGVNECVPRFSEFVRTLEKHADILHVDLYTHMLYDAPGGGTRDTLTHWDFAKDRPMLARRSGSLAMRIRLQRPWPQSANRQSDGVLAAPIYASWMSSASAAIANLAPLLPAPYVDAPFPGRAGSKFEMLNGWRLPQAPYQYRLAYQRGRWFLRRQPGSAALTFELGLPGAATGTERPAVVQLNGQECCACRVTAGTWRRVTVDLAAVAEGAVFAVEIQVKGGDDSLDGSAFGVRNRRYLYAAPSAASAALPRATGAQAGTIYAVIPVFNRVEFTRQCIRNLQAQTGVALHIIVVDGGSTDGTIAAIRAEFPDVTVLTAKRELWWAGAMALGIEQVLHDSQGPEDCVLMMNNDTQIPPDYAEKLQAAQAIQDAAVGALIVDSRDTTRILDAGEYIDWASYTFPVKSQICADEAFCDDVDVLPGRGSLVPVRMIRVAGNVDAQLLPHYLADYEFFTRLKRHGFRLGVCYETALLAHIEETGIIGTTGKSGFRPVWRELFSRRSMSNVVDHWRFVGRHAPAQFRRAIRLRLARRVVAELTLRTPLRPVFLPVYWFLSLPSRIAAVIARQPRVFKLFGRSVRTVGIDVLCNPRNIPGLIRLPLYLAGAPGPLRAKDISRCGLNAAELHERGILRTLRVDGWYGFQTLRFDAAPDANRLRRLFWSAWNPLRKIANSAAWRSDLKRGGGTGP